MNPELITKTQFDAICSEHAPNKWIIFWYKYFFDPKAYYFLYQCENKKELLQDVFF